MAVIQISKIQVRRGTTIEEGGMPQLASGEIGWSVDEQRLFIGNGSIAEGAPAIGNTEILTQFSTATINLFDCLYSYYGTQTSVIVTGTATNFFVERTLQERLDDNVSVKAFGAKGDGSTDDTESIRRAINEHYLKETNNDKKFKKQIFFPAGVYLVSDTIYLPSDVQIVGEGQFNSVIKSNTNTNKTIFRSKGAWNGIFTATWNSVENILIDSIGFEYNLTNSLTATTSQLLVLDKTKNSTIRNCSFTGAYSIGDVPAEAYEGLYIQSENSFNNNITLENLIFKNLKTGVKINGKVSDINIIDSNFYNLRTGIETSNCLRTIVERNSFEYIDREAIAVSTSSYFLTNGNSFENVGSGGSNDQIMSYPVINFNTSTFSVSSNDIFKRRDYVNTTSAIKPYVSGVTELHLTEKKFTLTTATDQILEYIPFDDRMTNIQVNYALEKTGNRTRTGSFVINASSAGINYTDTYNYLGASSIENTLLKAEFTNSNSAVVLKINQLSDATTGNISFSINYQT